MTTKWDWLVTLFGLAVLGWCCCAEIPINVHPNDPDCARVCAHLQKVGCIEAASPVCWATCTEHPNDIQSACLLRAPTPDSINDCGTITCTTKD